jgi:hypothetical protein
LLILEAISASLYLISLKISYPLFQNTRLQDPLAEIHSLFPLYYIALILLIISAILVILCRSKNKFINFSILLLIAVMLWYTKYYLAGFTWEPDGPRNLGVSLQISQILNGVSFPNSAYGAQYPISYIIEYSIYYISGMNSSTYLHLMPLANIVIFTSLIYAFTSKLFNFRVAFFASLLSILGMHYVIFIMGAHTTGLILLMSVLILILYKGISWASLTIAITIMVVMSHPISPILLGIFLGATLLTYYSRQNIKSQIIIAGLLFICILGWYFWPHISFVSSRDSILSSITEDLSNRILPDDLNNTLQLTTGKSFLYSYISSINRVVYLLYGLFVSILIFIVLVITYRKQKYFRLWLVKLGGLSRNQIFLTIAAPVLLVATILMSELDPVLMERGLTLAILAISGVVASLLYTLLRRTTGFNKILSWSGTVLVLIFLVMSFPLISYSIDAYSSFPSSEENGLKFTSDHISLSDKVLVDASGPQIILFQSVVKKTYSTLSPIKIENSDVFIIRSTAYYYASLRYDFSFDNNRLTRNKNLLDTSSEINSIYFNPTTSIYLKIK